MAKALKRVSYLKLESEHGERVLQAELSGEERQALLHLLHALMERAGYRSKEEELPQENQVQIR